MSRSARPRLDLSSAFTHDRLTSLASVLLLVVAALSWAGVIRTSFSMHDGMHMDAMAYGWKQAATFVMQWAVMMAAMMLPSALPLIALYSAIEAKKVPPTARAMSVTLFSLVYLVVWVLSGIPVYLAGWLLEIMSPARPEMLIAAVLVVAGAYQLSPLKQACLRACRTPLGFFMGHWRAGLAGSLAMAWAHAAYCLGCCCGREAGAARRMDRAGRRGGARALGHRGGRAA